VPALAIALESSSSLVFSWDSSTIDDGGLPLTGYVVSKDDGDFEFDTVSISAPASSYTYAVTESPGKTYRFRLAAVNMLGTGHVVSDELRLVATDAPGTPTLALEESSRALEGFKLNFERPVSDGGSPHIGFLLYRDEGIAASPFTLIFNGSSKPEISAFTVTGLQTALTYTF
jgi:hypothetical protein